MTQHRYVHGEHMWWLDGCPDPDRTPSTEAGRALLAREQYNERSFALITADAIIAIEEEVASRTLAHHDEVLERLSRPGNRADVRKQSGLEEASA